VSVNVSVNVSEMRVLLGMLPLMSAVRETSSFLNSSSTGSLDWTLANINFEDS